MALKCKECGAFMQEIGFKGYRCLSCGRSVYVNLYRDTLPKRKTQEDVFI